MPPPLPTALALALAALAALAAFVTAGGEPGPFDRPGLHNVFRLLDGRLYSGSAPEGEGGFRSLADLGVRTVLSVDGARPEVALAERFGLRYVHVPVGYDGLPREEVLRLARAVRDLPGPVYLHCHRGLHRGPAAAAAVRLCLDPRCTAAEAAAGMVRAGTDPQYAGLYAAVRALGEGRPGQADLDRLPADFPAVARVAALTSLMAALDARWDALKAIRAAGWQSPPAHPDLAPAAEALAVLEHYREAARLPEVRARPAEFRELLAGAEGQAGALHRALRGPVPDAAAAEAAFRQSAQSCTRCHGRFRDNPRGP